MERGGQRWTEAVHVRVSGRLYEQVSRLAADLQMSRSEALRGAIPEGLTAVVGRHRPGRGSEDSFGRA